MDIDLPFLSLVDPLLPRPERGEENAERRAFLTLTPVPELYISPEFGRSLARVSRTKVATPNRRFQFNKRRQLFIRPDNETLPVVVVSISNEDGSPARIYR